MAKLVLGSTIASIRNKLGDTVYLRTRAGDVSRAYVIPTDPKTTGQLSLRAIMSTVSKMWGETLSENERTQWNTFAVGKKNRRRTGMAGPLTGQQWFVKLNLALYLNFATTITSPPPHTNNKTPPQLPIVISVSATTFTIDAPSPPIPPGYRLTGGFSAPRGPGSSYLGKNVTDLLYADSSSAWPTNFWPTYTGHFPAPTAGQKIIVALKYINEFNGVSWPRTRFMVTAGA
jgi:hypothetical protein